MFRGQGNAEWEILPSLARLNPKKSPIAYTSWKDLEDGLLKEFKKFASMHLAVEPKTKLEWMIQAQHHGLPTRLLDWSTNPLKALYFAVENTSYDSIDGKVFVFAPRMWSTSSDDINTENDSYLDVFYPVVINDRVFAQEGCFTLFPQKSNFDNFTPVEEGFSTQHALDVKALTIKKEIKPLLRKELERLGISDMTMFPGLDGISKFISRQYGAM